jgi:MerR family transcriptional regulator/heat shock protein HspR
MGKALNNNQMESTDPVFTLGVASSLSGVPEHSIRQYIDRGLIIPYTKESKRHLFSQVDIIRLKYIQKKISEDGLNIAGIKAVLSLIPCWAIRKCKVRDRDCCDAFTDNAGPCWEASEKAPECRNVDCRECGVYRVIETEGDVKSVLRRLVQ